MRLTTFENHRKDKHRPSHHISVITRDNTIESGWTNGRTLDEIETDFGVLNINWFWSQTGAHAYIVKNKNK